MRSLICLVPRLLPCLLPLACDFPVSTSKYEVEPLPFERVVASFARGSTSCDACLRANCRPVVEACADTTGCPEFAECVQQDSTPAGPARCTSQYDDVTLATVAPYYDARTCWAACISDCGIGRDWGCLGEYQAPHPPRDTIIVQHSLSYLCQGRAVPNALVTLCETEAYCSKRVTTDAAGAYVVELPVSRKVLGGWRGARRVTGDLLVKPHRLERNLPIWTDQVEDTALVSDYCAAFYQQALASQVGPEDWAAAFSVQLFDCRITGAEGVVLEVKTAPEARIAYVHSDGAKVSFHEDSSKATGEGAVVIANVAPGDHEIVAYESTSRERVASAHVTVSYDDYIIYNLFPEPAE